MESSDIITRCRWCHGDSSEMTVRPPWRIEKARGPKAVVQAARHLPPAGVMLPSRRAWRRLPTCERRRKDHGDHSVRGRRAASCGCCMQSSVWEMSLTSSAQISLGAGCACVIGVSWVCRSYLQRSQPKRASCRRASANHAAWTGHPCSRESETCT